METVKSEIRKVHCLFEQSGTFKKEFKKLGFNAADYDICNDFGETDYIINLFVEIRKAYDNKPSIFDDINQDDLIFAFFPCIRFEDQIILSFRGQQHGLESWTEKQKMLNCMKLQRELTELYNLINKLFIICMDRNLKLILENPYSEQHYLRRYWCILPAIIDTDRRERGDYFKKPTQYWFVNCQPKHNLIFEALNYNAIDCKDAIRKMNKSNYEKTGAKNCKIARSMIHPDYANRFIREYIL